MKYVFLAAVYWMIGYLLPSFSTLAGVLIVLITLLFTAALLFYWVETYLADQLSPDRY